MLYRLSEGVYSKYTIEELRSRFKRVDLIIIDLDECLFPGYSQTILGKLMFLDILLRVSNLRDWKFLPQLLSGGIFILTAKVKRAFGINTSNLKMINRYEHTVRKMPKQYFYNLAKLLPAMSYYRALDTIRELSNKAPVGIISLGIDVILKEYLSQSRPYLSFFDSNVLLFEKVKDREIFKSYHTGSLKTNNFHKRQIMEERLGEFRARCPLVIGHNEDDAEMAGVARERKGIGIGFNLSSSVEDTFDVRITAEDWQPLYRLIQMLQRDFICDG